MSIAARRIEERDRHFTTIDPSSGQPLSNYDLMSDEQAAAVVDQAHAAFGSWSRTSLEERGAAITRLGETLRAASDEIADLMSREMGKLRSASADEVASCAAICDYTVGEAKTYLADEERPLAGGGVGLVTYRPIGVIYGIQPWNFPLYQVIRYAVANVAAGNTVLLKHAENVTGSGLLIEDLFRRAGFPEGVFSVLVIDHDQSDRIIEHERVRGVTMTGSTKGGAHIAAKAGEVVKKTVLELGSNDAYMVLEDADLDLAVDSCVRGRIYNNGETCIAAKRFVVVDAVYEAFRDRFVARMKAIRCGDPFDAESELGPMAREDLRDGLHEQVRQSVEKGAKMLCGGEIPDARGWYYPATVLENVSPGMPAYDDELFGPVAALIRVSDEAEAIRVANDSRYGLGGGIFSRDVERARAIARDAFDTGMVFINGYDLAQANMPFGGVKQSGYGREHGGAGIREFVNIKAVNMLG